MQFRVLGRVEADHDGEPVPLGRRRERCLFGVLLLDAGTPIPAERMAALLWDDQPTATARAALNTHMSRLRNRLDPHHDGSLGIRLVSRNGGYLAEVDPQRIDAARFRTMVERARTVADPVERAARLREALALWRGPILADEATPRLRERIGAELTELRMTATELMVDAELAGGRHQDLVGELAALTAEHPYREGLAAQLMLALYRSDRYAEALAAYQGLSERLAEGLGVAPGAQVSKLYTAMLRRDVPPGVHSASQIPRRPPARETDRAPSTGPERVPRQLPAAPPWFTGRADELSTLSKALASPTGGETVPIVAIGGSGGVGKTWLALRWAYQNLHRFPDGQLFVNLHGFDPSMQPTPPATAIRGFLDALGAAPSTIPADPDAQIGLYRSLMAGRRMLIVLDNARDTTQVTDLLPGSATCTVIVSSRDRLTGLVSRHGADCLSLDVLGEAESWDLLARRLGVQRLAEEPDAAAALLAGCGGLPLALGIAAARAATQPASGLAAIAEELRDTTTRLSALDEDDVQASLRAVLSWSCAALTERQAEVFALLGFAADPDISLPAAAALAGLPAAETIGVLRALERRSLVQQHTTGRWRMHDLVRLYAAEQAQVLPADRRSAAISRLVSFCLHTAFAAGQLLDPHRPPIALADPVAGVDPHPLPDEAAALAWLDAEHGCLLALQQRAGAWGRHREAWQLAWTLDPLHGRRGHLHDNVASWQAGLAAAQHVGDLDMQTLAHRRLGNAFVRADRFGDGTDHLGHALEVAEQAGDPAGQAPTHLALALAFGQQGNDERALEHASQAGRLYRGLDNPVREAIALNMVGWYLTRLGRHDEARTNLRSALALSRRHSFRDTEADTLDSLGYLAYRAGQHADAGEHYEQALTLYRDLGNSYGEADTLERLGTAHAAVGDHARARGSWRSAIELYEAQRRASDAGRLRQRMRDLDAAPVTDVPASGAA
ncbi:AfsR/SARP family transcriptional regulator [Rugosimonospora africana]|uniref:AfsR/SARP family transcriptional regulator n=1 Tax=Rugosimonospora africana TaxID=556532 RepID=UPI001944E4C3|nr:BTAD domain-containing putative transcriptional regulator [Rugosimonospora africana]